MNRAVIHRYRIYELFNANQKDEVYAKCIKLTYLLTFLENRLLLFSHPSPNNSQQQPYQTVSDFVYWTNIIQGEYNVNTNKCTVVF